MDERIRAYQEVLREGQIKALQEKCGYDEDYEVFEIENYVNGLAIVRSGEKEWDKFSDETTNIINSKGEFVEISLNERFIYSDGKIVKLKEDDKGSYYFKISRILEKAENTMTVPTEQIYSPRNVTSFFAIKVTRYSNKRDEETEVYTFVINSKLEVIASFKDRHLFGIQYDGYTNCEEYTERDFCFINNDRNYLIFSQKIVANSEEDGFFDSHMYGIAPDAYDDFLRDNDPYYYSYEREEYDDSIDEEELDEDTIQKSYDKSKGTLDEDDYDDIPYLKDINFFFEDTKNKLYKDKFTEYYKTLFGIIDTKHKAVKELIPFTDTQEKVINIVRKRIREMEEYSKWGGLRTGWDWNDSSILAPVLQSKFICYPPRVQGLTLKYLYTYYPHLLEYISKHGILIIPNKLLNTLNNTKLVRDVRLRQEVHLKYSNIFSSSDTLCSTECQGVVSSFQGKNLREIIYSKGGTKYLVELLRRGKLEIEKDVLEELSSSTENKIEQKCYDILLTVIEEGEYYERQRQAEIEAQIDDDMIKEANHQFNEMMDDFDAWGNTE